MQIRRNRRKDGVVIRLPPAQRRKCEHRTQRRVQRYGENVGKVKCEAVHRARCQKRRRLRRMPQPVIADYRRRYQPRRARINSRREAVHRRRRFAKHRQNITAAFVAAAWSHHRHRRRLAYQNKTRRAHAQSHRTFNKLRREVNAVRLRIRIFAVARHGVDGHITRNRRADDDVVNAIGHGLKHRARD